MKHYNKLPLYEDGTLHEVEKLFMSLIKTKGFGANNSLVKIDLLENLLTLLRLNYHKANSEQSLETLLDSKVTIVNNKISIIAPKVPLNIESGTPPIQLQSALLRYLLIYHNQANPVHVIIENFIKTVWDDLYIVDYKRTKTGVIRCHTNTKFAACTLRDYGFLKFSKKEKFKTWKLSLSGFLVASKLIESGTWQPNAIQERGFDLRKDLLDANDILNSYGSFIGQLSKLCEPQATIFKTYNDILKSAHKLLNKYWNTITDYKLSSGERRINCMKLINELEQHKDMEKFYNELSIATLNSKLLKKIIEKSK